MTNDASVEKTSFSLVQAHHFWLVDLCSCTFLQGRCLEKLNFKDLTRPKSKKLGAQHVKLGAAAKNLGTQSIFWDGPGYRAPFRQQPCFFIKT